MCLHRAIELCNLRSGAAQFADPDCGWRQLSCGQQKAYGSIAESKKRNREQENENVAKSCQNVTIPKRDHFGNSRFAYETNAFFNIFDLVTIWAWGRWSRFRHVFIFMVWSATRDFRKPNPSFGLRHDLDWMIMVSTNVFRYQTSFGGFNPVSCRCNRFSNCF